MKSLSSMASSQPRSLGGENSSSSRRGQAIRSCLPIVVTAVLVIFLGGFPPTTWVLLFRTFGQLNTLLTYQGPGVILPLIILIVQSLLLLIAWALLGWVILREGTYLMTMQSKAELDRLLAFQSTAGELISSSQMVTKQLQLEQDFHVTTDALEEEQDYRVTTDALEEEQDYRVMMAPLRREKEIDARTVPLRREKEIDARTVPLRREKEIDARTAPLRREKDYGLATVPLGVTTGRLRVTTSPLIQEETEEDSWASRGVQSSSVQLPSVQSRRIQLPSVPSRNVESRSVESRSVSVQPRGMQLPSVQSRRGQTGNGPSKTAQLPEMQTRNGPPRNVQPSRVEPDNVQSRNPQSRRTSSSRRGLSTGHLQEEDLLENPFDKELPFNPETDDNVKQVRNRMVTKKEEPAEEEDNDEEDDNPFVFGNPFDGPLPDVFRYDADLRRSVMDMLEEDVPQSNGSKAKEDRAQKTKHL